MPGDPTPFNFPQSRSPSYWPEYGYGPFTGYRRDYDWSPLADFRREIDRFFDDFSRKSPFSGYGYAGFSGQWPKLDFIETEDEVLITAEVPGMNEKDVELYFDNGVLTIRGMKKTDKDEPGYSERFYGRFERQVPLPYSVDGEHCTAEFRDGLLKVSFKKLAETENKKKIPINAVTRHIRKSRDEDAAQRSKPAFVGA